MPPIKPCCDKPVDLSGYVTKDELLAQAADVYEHMLVWAEESGGTDANSAEWSFGNGATGFMGLVIDWSEWEIEGMGFQADTYPATGTIQIDAMDYSSATPGSAAANTLASVTLASATDGGGAINNAYKYQATAVPVSLAGVSVLGFITRGETGNISDARVMIYLRRKLGNFIDTANL